jgi:hypothetical protein
MAAGAAASNEVGGEAGAAEPGSRGEAGPYAQVTARAGTED